MGVDLIPRLRKMRRYSMHYSLGGSDKVVVIFLFAGARGTALEAVNTYNAYVKKSDALDLADRLERLYRRLRKEDVRPIIEHRQTAPRDELMKLVLAIARDIGAPEPPEGLREEMVQMISDPQWDWGYDLPHLIRLCRKGGGFWWC